MSFSMLIPKVSDSDPLRILFVSSSNKIERACLSREDLRKLPSVDFDSVPYQIHGSSHIMVTLIS